jgi:RNA polymerase sigma factor (sigma-70 family)
MQNPNADISLVYELQNGREVALNRIVQKYRAALFTCASKIVPAEDAEEIVQNIFEKLWRAPPKLEKVRNLCNYLFRMTRNACISRHKILKKELTLQDKADTNDITDACIETRIVMKETIAWGYEMIRSMPPRQRAIADLLFREGLSIGEVAAQLNIKASTVRAQKAAIAKQLRTGKIKGRKSRGPCE